MKQLQDMLKYDGLDQMNFNIRCIETNYDIDIEDLNNEMNFNIRCIETIFQESGAG